MKALYWCGREICRMGLSLAFHIEYEGKENIPSAAEPYLLASNHVSYIDPVLLAMGVRPMIRYLAKAELFGRSAWRWLFQGLGCVSVERGTGDISVIDRCAALVAQGEHLGIFPEGTRHKDAIPGRPKSGMALIAKRTGSAVLPCCVDYSGRMGFRSRIIIRYGKLIPFEALGLEDDSPRALKRATKQIWGEILKLLGGASDERE